jgi:hypothetical protein
MFSSRYFAFYRRNYMAISNDIEQWKDYRTNERPVFRRVKSNRYIDVRISRNDCVLTTRRETKSEAHSISFCSDEVNKIKDLYFDPNSRFQKGGTGYLRIPLDEPRNTRADAPEWFHRRDDYFKTLKTSRAARAEQIFCGFYLDDKTDRKIAETLGWRKDSVKKERTDLLRRGNRFFGNFGQVKHPP